MSERACRFVYKHYRFYRRFYARRRAPAPMGDDSYEGTTFWGRHGLAHHYQRGISLWSPTERGGYTFCFVYEGDDASEPIAVGLAECSPKDAFCYRLGREISRGRALDELEKREG
jgi:hypothetical protein